MAAPRAAIVDYGMGNLFSVQQACERVGLQAVITASAREIGEAHAVILPGVGAFGDAMAALRHLDLIDTLKDAARRGTPLLGICLGMQLLMSESAEFGRHQGLDILPGDVVRLEPLPASPRRIKVPEVGWNQVWPSGPQAWAGTLLEGLPDGACLYFVHSYYVRPADAAMAVAKTTYGSLTYCSSVAHGNIFGCQFHPERSGLSGLHLYRQLARRLGVLIGPDAEVCVR